MFECKAVYGGGSVRCPENEKNCVSQPERIEQGGGGFLMHAKGGFNIADTFKKNAICKRAAEMWFNLYPFLTFKLQCCIFLL